MSEVNSPAPEAYVLSLLAEGRYEAAFGVIQELGGEELYAREFSNQALQMLECGRSKEAEELFIKALALDDKLAPAKRGLGLLHLRRGHPQSAVVLLREAAGLEPESAVGQALLGIALCHQGLVFEAIPYLLRAISLEPQLALARAALDKTFNTLGDTIPPELYSQIETALLEGIVPGPAGLPRPTLSVCMIVKDEADNLPRCLGSIRKAADEIVVVDTGSQDDTVAIAKKYGAKIGHFAWCDDFAAARNYALSLAAGDWVLILDADDEMAPGGGAALRLVLEKEAKAEILALSTRIPCANGMETFISHPRLFRNHLGLHYINGVHEQLIYPDGQAALPQLNTGIVVYHHGYLEGDDAMRERRERNLRILRAEIARRPEDPNPHFFLGKELRMQQNFAAALPCFQKALLLSPKNPHSLTRMKIFAYLGEALIALGRWQEGQEILQQGLQDYPNNAELLFSLGEALRLSGKESEAAVTYEAATRGSFGGRLANQDFTCRDLKPRLRLAEFALARGDWREAERQWEKARAIRGDSPPLRQLLARIELVRNAQAKPQMLAAEIKENRARLQAEPENLEVRRVLVEALLESGKTIQAEEEALAGVKLAPNNSFALALLGEVYLLAGRREEAEKQFLAALAADAKNAAAYTGLGNLALLAEAWGKARENFETAISLAPQAVLAWLGLGRSCLEERAIEATLKCYQTAAQLSSGNPEVMEELAKAKKRLMAMLQPAGAKP